MAALWQHSLWLELALIEAYYAFPQRGLRKNGYVGTVYDSPDSPENSVGSAGYSVEDSENVFFVF